MEAATAAKVEVAVVGKAVVAVEEVEEVEEMAALVEVVTLVSLISEARLKDSLLKRHGAVPLNNIKPHPP